MAKKERKPRKPRVPKEKKVKAEKSNEPNYDKLWDFTKVFFGNKPKYNDVLNYQKKKHRFMINRFMAIRYPAAAERFNINKINPIAVINLWHIVAMKFNRTPDWFYTKTKKPKEKSNVYFVPTEETIEFYLQRQKISRRDFNDAMKFYKEELSQELEIIEKTLTENG